MGMSWPKLRAATSFWLILVKVTGVSARARIPSSWTSSRLMSGSESPASSLFGFCAFKKRAKNKAQSSHSFLIIRINYSNKRGHYSLILYCSSFPWQHDLPRFYGYALSPLTAGTPLRCASKIQKQTFSQRTKSAIVFTG